MSPWQWRDTEYWGEVFRSMCSSLLINISSYKSMPRPMFNTIYQHTNPELKSSGKNTKSEYEARVAGEAETGEDT